MKELSGNFNRLSSNQNFANVVFPLAKRYDKEEFNNITTVKCNFGGPSFFSCKFINCAFDECDLGNTGLFENTLFKNCNFEKCDLRSVGMGGVIFDNCTFIKCDMRGTFLGNAKWDKCTLQDCRFRDQKFSTENLINCTFIGVLREIVFKGKNNSKLRLNLENSRFDCVDFLDCDLSTCIPPKDKNHYYITEIKEKIVKSDAILATKDANTQKIVKRRLNKIAGMNQYIFHPKTIRELEDVEVANTILEIFGIR